MNKRNDLLLNIRPVLDLETSHSSEIESFQNQVLRPILKFQNELLVTGCTNWLLAHKQDIGQMKREKAHELLDHLLKNNKQLKWLLTGMALGMMTRDEYDFYQKNKRECNKRLISMLIKRLQDQLVA